MKLQYFPFILALAVPAIINTTAFAGQERDLFAPPKHVSPTKKDIVIDLRQAWPRINNITAIKNIEIAGFQIEEIQRGEIVLSNKEERIKIDYIPYIEESEQPTKQSRKKIVNTTTPEKTEANETKDPQE